jgi:outer membrane receptor protein involved in Fe transport
MRKPHRLLALLLITCFFTLTCYAQNITLSGNVKNNVTSESVPAVSITVKGASAGTFTDDKGNFRLSTSQKLPITIVISSIGFETKEVEITSAGEALQLNLVPALSLGTEVVVSASRVPERILESPVSIERVGLKNIQEAAVPSAYDMLANLKGVDVVTSSILFKTPTTRGFGGSGNPRVNQFMDGMDNQAPGLNFSVGSIIGITDLDLESVEVLPGASSALYGAGGMNGTILLNSKNPFKYPGLSVQVKQGMTHLGKKQRDNPAPYYDWAFRWAKAFNDKFAFKVNMNFIKARDWENQNYSNYDRINFRIKEGDRSLPDYDGVNVYGDESPQNMVAVGTSIMNTGLKAVIDGIRAQVPGATQAQVTAIMSSNPQYVPLVPLVPVYYAVGANKIPNRNVTRTGYAEPNVVDYNAYNYKFNGALHYKIKSNIEAILSGNWGTGTTVYTGNDRYSLRNLIMGQYKLELRGPDFYVRGYTIQENAGESYNSTALAQLINESWKASTTWYPQYMVAYSTAVNAGASETAAHAAARGFADVGRLAPGTPEFNARKEALRRQPIPSGALFTDKTDMYHLEGFYDASAMVKNILDVQVGANYRLYDLNSNGSIFADKDGRKIRIGEYGAFLQLGKRFLDDKLKLTASGRFDKSKNFKGRFTPRVTAVYTIMEDQNIRVSFQNAFRNPHTQNQYIDLDVVTVKLIGSLPEFKDRYNLIGNQPYSVASVSAARDAYIIQGQPAPAALALLRPVDLSKELGPETMTSFEAGYKGLFHKRILVDAFFYYSKYKNFIGQAFVAQSKPPAAASSPANLLNPSMTQVYSIAINNDVPVNAFGGGLSIDFLLAKGYVINSNISYNELGETPKDFFTQFNTPKFRYNLGFSNSNVYKNIGFGFNFRYQTKFTYQGTFAVGEVPAFGTLDGQVSYKFIKEKIMFKLGATNLLNKYYINAFGNPEIGGLYYVSLGFNVF